MFIGRDTRNIKKCMREFLVSFPIWFDDKFYDLMIENCIPFFEYKKNETLKIRWSKYFEYTVKMFSEK